MFYTLCNILVSATISAPIPSIMIILLYSTILSFLISYRVAGRLKSFFYSSVLPLILARKFLSIRSARSSVLASTPTKIYSNSSLIPKTLRVIGDAGFVKVSSTVGLFLPVRLRGKPILYSLEFLIRLMPVVVGDGVTGTAVSVLLLLVVAGMLGGVSFGG
jgi:hypothetical protein